MRGRSHRDGLPLALLGGLLRDDLIPDLRVGRDGSALTEGVIQGFIRRAAQRAGLFNNGPHMLRHTFCSHLAMRGAPGRAIQELAGHRDLTTTQRYMHLSPAAIDSAIRLLDAPGVPSPRGNIVATGFTETANSSR